MKPDVKPLEFLSEPVLAEVVREAEKMVESQYQSHLATEQRGFTFAGISLATGSAAFAAFISIQTDKTHFLYNNPVALIFSLGLFLSGSLSIASVWPRTFFIPGNEPKNWIPDHWPQGKRDLKATRLEQAKVLQTQIWDNRKTAKRKANLQRASIVVAYSTTLVAGIVMFCSPHLR